MFKKLQIKSWLLLVAMLLVGAGSVWADDIAYKTLTFPDDNSSNNKISAYDKTWTATCDDFSWTIANFNNNSWNGNWTYIKCGRKNNASTGTITTASTIDRAVTKVVVTVDAFTSGKVNSTKLEVASDASFTNPQTVTVTCAQGDLAYTIPTATANCYYRLTFDCASGSSNGLVTISKIVYYTENKASGSEAHDPVFSLEGGTYSTPQTVTVSSEGAAEIWYTTDGTDPMAEGVTPQTIESNEGTIPVNNTMTIKAVGIDEEANASGMTTVNYVIKPNAPTFNYADGYSFKGSLSVELTQDDAALIIYTTDGTDPTYGDVINGDEYDGAFTIDDNVTVKAIAVDDYENVSDIATATYYNSDKQITDFDITLNRDFWGLSSANGQLNVESITGTDNNVTVTLYQNGGAKLYTNASQTRFYNGSQFIFEAPAGYVFTAITFTAEGDYHHKDNQTFNQGTGEGTQYGWNGTASVVALQSIATWRCPSVNVKLQKVESASVTVGSALFATYVPDAHVSFPASVTAYVVPEVSGSSVKLQPVTAVPAHTPVIVEAKAAGNYALTIEEEADAPAANLLQASNGLTTTGDDTTLYVLAQNDGKVGFSLLSSESRLSYGKAYLVINEEGAKAFLPFNDDSQATAIENVTLMEGNMPIFNLNGCRVARAEKGVYIQNGKKIVIN